MTPTSNQVGLLGFSILVGLVLAAFQDEQNAVLTIFFCFGNVLMTATCALMWCVHMSHLRGLRIVTWCKVLAFTRLLIRGQDSLMFVTLQIKKKRSIGFGLERIPKSTSYFTGMRFLHGFHKGFGSSCGALWSVLIGPNLSDRKACKAYSN